MNGLIYQHLLRAQQRMKTRADKNRSEKSYEVGDLVYQKLQPYVQTTVARRANCKLSFRFFGPFPISAELPETLEDSPVPVSFLDQRLCLCQGKVISRVLVKWSSWLEEMATWEDELLPRQRYPEAPAWGQGGFQEGRDVSDLTSPSNMKTSFTKAPTATTPVEPDHGAKPRTRRPNMKFLCGEWINQLAHALCNVIMRERERELCIKEQPMAMRKLGQKVKRLGGGGDVSPAAKLVSVLTSTLYSVDRP